MIFAAIQWRPQLHPVVCGVLVMFLGAWLYWTYRRLRQRFSPGKSMALIAPKLLVTGLLVFALFEPVLDFERRESLQGKLIVATDVSSSMDVVDGGIESRRARAGKIVERIKQELPGDVGLVELEFDTQLGKAGEPGSTNLVRGTDLGGALLGLSGEAALGIVLLTDGGDEPLRTPTVPGVPVTVVGMGTDATNWNDVAITGVEAPATVEKDTQFEIAADLVARGATARQVSVRLEREGKPVASQSVDLSRNRARVKFPVTCGEPGLHRYRVVVEVLPGELSPLNNERAVLVDVQKKALHVLFFTRELGQDFKMMRSEIGRDPGVAFTALFRTLSEHFTVQGDRLTGDEPIEAGFPTDLKVLQLFDCLIVGSFAASDWSKEQFAVLTNYVAEGGALIVLGGEKSFGLGGYAGTPLAALLPWQIESGEPELARGTFAVSIPVAGQGNPIVAGLETAALSVSSANHVGPLKAGATALLSANVGGRNIPVVAVQPYGKGRVLGVASNTTWEWARKNEALRNAYGLFWRQAVRNVTGKSEGGRHLSVRWDKENYLPGEQATAEVRVSGLVGGRLSATLQSQMLPVDPRPGHANEYVAQCRFKERGEYVFRLVAYQNEAVMETYEKVLLVAPPLAEGARLELDPEPLKKIAERTGGVYFPEGDAEQIPKTLAARFWQRTITTETPLVTAGPHFALLVLALCVVEWWLRRKANLI